jgi:hypothetical protein
MGFRVDIPDKLPLNWMAIRAKRRSRVQFYYQFRNQYQSAGLFRESGATYLTQLYLLPVIYQCGNRHSLSDRFV